MAFNIGDTVGPYRIMEQLGQGGMATVFKAYHANLDRHVAIKVLHPSFKEDASFFMRFQREAQIVARLEHPHIVPVYDFAESNQEPYLVMKFIEGDTLKGRLKRNPLTLQEAIRIMSAVASALTYAHERDILHRDVKPSNVMMDSGGVPYLADFGLARMASGGESTMSRDVLIGTPNYISPEQAMGVDKLGPGTDIYSLGIMLYEIVVGRVPFSADTPYAVIHDHIYKPPPTPTDVNPTVPAAVEVVLLRALAKNAQERYQSAVEMMEAFKAAVEAADMRELSAASVRLENFETATPVPNPVTPTPTPSITTTPSNAEFDQYIRNIVAQSLTTGGSTPAIPSPQVSYPSQASNTQTFLRLQRSRRRRRNFWIMIGTLGAVFTCILSLGVVINALNNPLVSQGFEPDATAVEITPTPVASINVDISLEEAQAWVEREPDNAAARLSLVLLLSAAGQNEAALENANNALSELDISADLLAEAAQIAAQEGYDRQAVLLWLAAYHMSPTDPMIRNEAGQYVYRQIGSLISQEPTQWNTYTQNTYPDSAFIPAMNAQGLLVSMRRLRREEQLERINRLLDTALERDPNLAETHLIYGNYYAAAGDLAAAEEAWRFAASFADAPQWVIIEADRLINQGNEGATPIP